MEQEKIVEEVLSAIISHPDCDLDTLTGYCDGLTWNHVLSAVDQLSREGMIRLRRPSRFLYLIASLGDIPHASIAAPASSEEDLLARSEAPDMSVLESRQPASNRSAA